MRGDNVHQILEILFGHENISLAIDHRFAKITHRSLPVDSTTRSDLNDEDQVRQIFEHHAIVADANAQMRAASQSLDVNVLATRKRVDLGTNGEAPLRLHYRVPYSQTWHKSPFHPYILEYLKELSIEGADMNQADFVIIGSGSAGSALAYRLSEDGKHSVIVIEAGGSDIGPFIQMPPHSPGR